MSSSYELLLLVSHQERCFYYSYYIGRLFKTVGNSTSTICLRRYPNWLYMFGPFFLDNSHSIIIYPVDPIMGLLLADNKDKGGVQLVDSICESDSILEFQFERITS